MKAIFAKATTVARFLETVRFAWATKFGLPPNDERLLRVTAREALEHVSGVYAFEQLIRERVAENLSNEDDDPFDFDDRKPGQRSFMGGALLADDGQSIVRPSNSGKKGQITITGPKAQKVADVPHLTGGAWPEWDELELSETDPAKEPLKIRW